jgi:hypothetical protein
VAVAEGRERVRAADREKFTIGLRALAAAFRTEVTEALIEGYWLGLEDIELALVGAAMRRALRECRFMPTPAELRGFGRHAQAVALPPADQCRAERRRLEAERERVRASWSRQLEAVRADGERGPVAIGELLPMGARSGER